MRRILGHRLFAPGIALLLVVLSGLACGGDEKIVNQIDDQPSAPPDSGIDIHQHLASYGDFSISAANLIALMDEVGIARSLIMPPPTSGDPDVGAHYEYTALQAVVGARADRLSLLGGGGILNSQMHRIVLAGRPPTAGELDDFEAQARDIAADGVAGFGEMAALHLSYQLSHPYIAIPPDHPMFLRLADVAAETGLPIDIHLELVVEDTETPAAFKRPPEGNNPNELVANLAPFEALLAHNRNARIVWTHVGWDNIGDMTTARLRSLLTAHTNLYCALKMLDSPGPLQVLENRPLYANGTIRPEWLELITDFPDRFLLGADEFVGAGDPGQTAGAPSTRGTWSLLSELPEGVARQIAVENPRAVYRFD